MGDSPVTKPKAGEPSDQELAILAKHADGGCITGYWNLENLLGALRECRERTLESVLHTIRLAKYGASVKVRGNPTIEEQNLVAEWGDAICNEIEKAVRALAARKESDK